MIYNDNPGNYMKGKSDRTRLFLRALRARKQLKASERVQIGDNGAVSVGIEKR